MSVHLAVQSLSNHLPVHDRDIHKEKEDYKEIVHESQKTKERFGENVERRGQVSDRPDQAEENSNPEHPKEATHSKHLSEGMTKQGGHIPQPVHKLRETRETEKERFLQYLKAVFSQTT